VEPQLTLKQIVDHDAVAPRLAAPVPHWRPGKAHGYHGLTIGTIMDELVRRIAGIPIADPWHDVSYAWIPRRTSFPGGADARGLGLARIVRECAAGRADTSAG
jgi:hypothetical protein